ncbi:MAG TPA: MtrB/PioB family outer membrane beta-barrel protein [Vicinamibacterales bacterium]|nr:MtrB/PioB family outer membrane beta-barrel protein [Vicinamibacterales bacterium]
MSNRMCTCLALLLSVAPAAAQTTPPSPPARSPQEPQIAAPVQGWMDFGVRFTDVNGDPARFQRYRDLGDGLFLERFRQEGERNGWLFSAAADHVGRRDQRYFVRAERPGRFAFSFEWDQIPLLISEDTRTLYDDEEDGDLEMDDGIQAATGGQVTRLIPFLGDARQFRSGSRRDTARVRAWFAPREDTDIRFGLTSARREGNMPFGAGFGFGLAVEVPATIDHRTTDLTTDIEWSNNNAMVGGGYNASWFQNDVPALVWDHPLVLVDRSNASSQGRMPLWPDSTYHVVNARGSVRLPGRSRLAAFLSLGTVRQDEQLLPHTINPAITPVIPLERQRAEAEARTTGANVTFTARPWRRVALDARYRLSDYDNRTPHFPLAGRVNYDSSASRTASEGPEPFSTKRHNTEVEVTFMPAGLPTFRAGWRGEYADRTFRIFETTSENLLRLSVDALGHARFSVRALYELGARDADGFDVHLLEAVNEQPGMRHYDVAARDRQRITVQATAIPIGWLGLNTSIAVGKDDYADDGQFGLRDNTHHIYTAGFTLTPSDRANVDVSYGFEGYDAFQTSRQASNAGEFVDPRRDWGTDQDDRVHTLMASLNLVRPFRNTDITFAYDYSRARATYVYEVGVVTDRTLPEDSPPISTITPPDQLPPVRNEWQRATADVKYYFTNRIAVGASYWYDDYEVEDFALANPRIAVNDLPGAVLLGYRYRPYTAHTGWIRVMVNW